MAGEPESLSFDRTIEINTAAPFVLSATSTQPNGTYTTAAVIGVTVHFSSPVVVVHDDYPLNCGDGGIDDCHGLPVLELDASGENGDREATYASGSGTADLVFEYEASFKVCLHILPRTTSCVRRPDPFDIRSCAIQDKQAPYYPKKRRRLTIVESLRPLSSDSTA